MAPKKTVSVAVTVVILITVMASITWLLMPTLAGPQIDSSWTIALNVGDTYDLACAMWIQDTYNAKFQDINQAYDWDAFGTNIVIIGGSRGLSVEAEWIGLKEQWYGIKRPDNYPDVTWHKDDATGKFQIVTSERTYTCDSTYDYGMIAKGYDYTKRRWVIVAIGYSQYATALASKYLIEDYNTVVKDNSYVVFIVEQKGGTEVTQWSLSDFDGTIVEYGG